MKGSSTALFKGLAALLAGLGLLPFFWAGIVGGDWAVARVTLVDPLVVAALCLAIGLLAPDRARKTWALFARVFARVPTPVLMVATGVIIVAAGVRISGDAYNRQPALTDELTQAFHGRILGAGRLSATPEAYAEFFETSQTITRDGRWFTEYPIGSGALAALGLGPLLSPFVLVLAAVAVWSFARRAYDRTTARVALILIALSPFAVLLSATRMNHVPTLALTALALAALAKWEATEHPHVWAAALGAALGAMVLVRPYDALLVGIPVALFQVTTVVRHRDLRLSLAPEFLAFVAVAAIQLWVNARTTGAPLLFGYAALNGPLHGPGFHLDPLGPPFTPSRGLDYVMLYLQQLDTALFESAVPALVFIVVGLWLTRPTKWDWLLAGLILSFLAGYGAYWHRGDLHGPRFLYPALVAFIVFSARFVILAKRTDRPWSLGAALMLPVCLVWAYLPIGDRSVGVWHRLSTMRSLPVSRSEDPAEEAGRVGLKNALVFVREPFHARLTARLRALGVNPFDAEKIVTDVDACALMTALDKSGSHPDVPGPVRFRTVLAEATSAGRAQPIPRTAGSTALSLVNGRPSSEACRREIAEDSVGTLNYARFLAAATIDSTGRLGGDVIYARTLGARDTILLQDERFARRQWYMYRREDRRNSGRFERIR